MKLLESGKRPTMTAGFVEGVVGTSLCSMVMVGLYLLALRRQSMRSNTSLPSTLN